MNHPTTTAALPPSVLILMPTTPEPDEIKVDILEDIERTQEESADEILPVLDKLTEEVAILVEREVLGIEKPAKDTTALMSAAAVESLVERANVLQAENPELSFFDAMREAMDEIEEALTPWTPDLRQRANMVEQFQFWLMELREIVLIDIEVHDHELSRLWPLARTSRKAQINPEFLLEYERKCAILFELRAQLALIDENYHVATRYEDEEMLANGTPGIVLLWEWFVEEEAKSPSYTINFSPTSRQPLN